MSLSILARAIGHTAAISWPTVLEAARGTLSTADCNDRLQSWSKALLDDARLDLSVSGVEHISSGQSYVVMSNHESLYDIPVLFQALPLELRMAAKAELFRLPLWGRAMQASGFVRLDRKKGREARALLLEAGKQLSASGLSLWVAPEGTRGPGDGRILPFKTGAFALASALALPILPVALRGTAAVLGKKQRSVRLGQSVRVSVLEPILATGQRDPEQLAAQLRERLEVELTQP